MPGKKAQQSAQHQVLILPIKNSPELSRKIGYLAAMQRAARNMALEWLREDPRLFRRQARIYHRVRDAEGNPAKDDNGRGLRKDVGSRPREYSLNGRFTDLVQRDRELPIEQRRWAGLAPRHIYDRGLELAYLSHQQFNKARRERLEAIEAIRQKLIADEYRRPDHREKDLRRLARLTRPHKAKVEFVSRKANPWTLDISSNQGVQVSPDRMSVHVKDSKHGFRIPLKRPLPRRAAPGLPYDWSKCTVKLVEKVKRRRMICNRPLRSVQYQLHITTKAPFPPVAEPDGKDLALDAVLGIDAGVKVGMATSAGEMCRNDGPHNEKRKYEIPKTLQRRIQRKKSGISCKNPGRRRRKLEIRRRELLRQRTADRKRVMTGHAIRLLQDGVQMVVVEDLNVKGMTASAKGGTVAPGQSVSAKRGLNRSVARAALAANIGLLQQQAAKHGVWLEATPARGSSQTCAKCGHWHPDNRKSQAVFECRACGFPGNADVNASVVLRNRGYYSLRKRQGLSLPPVDVAATGWRTQPSRPGVIPGEGVSGLQGTCRPGEDGVCKPAGVEDAGENAQTTRPTGGPVKTRPAASELRVSDPEIAGAHGYQLNLPGL